MRKMTACVLGIAMLAAATPSWAGGDVWDDLSWWGQSGATPGPYKDAERSGYWWWPKEPASNANDAELWGNRGVVYGMYVEPVPEPVAAPMPAPVPPPRVTRTATVFSHVLFDFDKSVLKTEGKAETDKVISDLKRYGKDTVVLEGHTCNVGTDEYNMGLGQRRANAVKKYMVESGIAESRVSTVSYGESQPAVPNDTPANRKLNRRVVFKISVVNE